MSAIPQVRKPLPASGTSSALTGAVLKWLPPATLCAAIGAFVDISVSGDLMKPAAVFSALGLATTGGVLLGLGFSLTVVAAGQLPRWRFVPWFVIGLGAAVMLAESLKVRQNLGGQYNTLALAALTGSLMLGGVLGLGGYAVELLTSSQAPRLQRYVSRTKLAIAAASVMCATLATIFDRTQFPDLYFGAHLALRWGSLIFLTYALVLFGFRWPQLKGWRLALVGLLGTLSASPWLLLHQPNQATTAAISHRPLVSIHLELARLLTDVDGDGYSSLLGGGDCVAFNARVNPGVSEIPGNGIDDNCAQGDGAPILAEAEDIPLPSEPSSVNVLLITVDTLRPDRMSVFGYGRGTTPNLNQWATDATRFSEAYTSGGWTSIAIPSLMAGRYPRHLSWNAVVATTKSRSLRPPLEGKLRAGEEAKAHYLLPIDDVNATLATLLQRRGMHTTAVVDGGFTGILSKEIGMARGFTSFKEVSKLPTAQRNDAGTRDLALKELRTRPTDRPFFLWVHFFGTHAPSSAHKEVPTFGESEADKYDHEIAFVDLQVGKLLSALNDVTERPTAVVLTADHGERFYNERSRGHGRDSAEDSLRIPLLIKADGLVPGQVSDVASLVDVVPTILELTGTPGPSRLDGVSLRKVASGAARQRTIFVDTFVRDASGTGFKLDLVVALNHNHKLVQNRIAGTQELSRRDDQRFPPRNLLPTQPDSALADELARYIEASGGPPRVLP